VKKIEGYAESFSKWASTEKAFEFWAERTKLFIDKAHGMQQ
jgi:hypothetical protein